jgi:hypothetical protein
MQRNEILSPMIAGLIFLDPKNDNLPSCCHSAPGMAYPKKGIQDEGPQDQSFAAKERNPSGVEYVKHTGLFWLQVGQSWFGKELSSRFRAHVTLSVR